MNRSFLFTTANKYKLNGNFAIARNALLDNAIEKKQPITKDEALHMLHPLISDEGIILDQLIQENIIGLNENNDIAYLYPVATEETGHRVRLADGREFSTMCAVDSLGCSATFNMDAEIFSFCKDTEAEVYMRTTKEQVLSVKPTGQLFVSYYDSWIEGAFNY